jgi:hypothetical protein
VILTNGFFFFFFFFFFQQPPPHNRVPTIKPEAALAFMYAWIHNEDYPVYNSTCPKPARKKKKKMNQHQSSVETIAAVQ